MAWTVTTYAGTRATGQPSKYRTCMFELIRGIGERYTALGLAETFTLLWYIGDRTAKANPTLADLEMLHCVGRTTGGITGADYNYAYENMERITDRIKVLINTGRFMTTSGGTTPWTVASVEAEIGASLDYPTKVNEARWWQACQDALDLLIYAYTELSIEPESVSGSSGSGPSGFPYDPQDAWDNRAAGGVLGGGPVGAGSVLWQMLYNGLNDRHDVRLFTETSGYFYVGVSSTPAILYGDFVDGNYIYNAGVVESSSYTGGSVYGEINGNSIDFSSTASGTKISDTFTLGAQMDWLVEITTATPSTVPFTNTDAPFDTSIGNSYVYLKLVGAEIWHDLTTYLTDQA